MIHKINKSVDKIVDTDISLSTIVSEPMEGVNMKKRDNGTGTIYQRCSGGWVGKIYIGRDNSGREKMNYLSGKFEGEVSGNFHIYQTRRNGCSGIVSAV